MENAKPLVNVRVEFKPILSSANICVEYSSDIVSVASRLIINNHNIAIESAVLKVVFDLENLNLKPETCRGLRWIGKQELHLSLEAESTDESYSDLSSTSYKFGGGYQHINQELLVSRIQACQSRCFCVGCGAQIFKPTCHFKRVLALPSENWSDFADIWFCHNHDGGHDGHGSHSKETPQAANINPPGSRDLLPRPDDCLVSSLYMLVSSGQAKSHSVADQGDKLICCRCGNFLGFVKRAAKISGASVKCHRMSVANDVYKIYFHAICFKKDLDKDLIPKLLTPQNLESKTENRLLSEQTIEEFMCHLLKDQSHGFTSFRFILEASLKFEGQSGVIILLWLLDQDLIVYSPTTASMVSPLSSLLYQCAPSRTMKLLYKAHFLVPNGCVEKQTPDVFKAWRKDNTVHSISLPYPLCKQLLGLLIASTKKLSASQRSLNGFHVGYLTAS